MKALSLLRAELLLHRQSPRSRLVLLLYPLLTLAPWPLFGSLAGDDLLIGPATALSLVSAVQPYTLLLLAAGLAGRGADRASRDELLPLLASSPFSNSFFVACRAAVLALLLLAASALPYLALFAAGLAGGTDPDPLALAGRWLLEAWPMALAMGWTWLALALIGGSDLAAILLLWLGGLLLGQVLSRLTSSFGWPFLDSPIYFRMLLGNLIDGTRPGAVAYFVTNLVATEGPYDPLLALERSAVDCGPALGLALVLLALAALRLGRCRADLPPRSFAWAPSLGRLRQYLRRDGGLGRERWLVLLALAPALFALERVERQAKSFFAWGQARFEAETRELGAPTEPALALLGITIEADLGRSAHLPDGRLESRFEELFEVRGPTPASHLAFRLDSRLTIESLAAESGGAPLALATRRHHNRLFVELERPLPPGATLKLAGRLIGRPADPRFRFPRGLTPGNHFGETWAILLRDPGDLARTRFAATELHPSISRNQVRLDAEDLFPLPRYSPWLGQSSPAPALSDTRAQSDATPEEDSPAVVPLRLALSAPAAWRLFSACGDASELAGGRSVLHGGCAMRPSELAVRGGLLEVQERGEVMLATTRAHAKGALPLLEALEQIHASSDRAWPGAPRLGKVVLLEGYKFFEPKAPQTDFLESRSMLRSQGSLLEIDERQLTAPAAFDPLELAGPLLVERLLRHRALDPEDGWAIATLVREVVTRRLGLRRARNAVLGGPTWQRANYSLPVAAYRNFESFQGGRRLAALIADLEGRVGGNAVQEGIQDFLAAGGGGEAVPPGRLADLIAAIGTRSGEKLDRFRADFLDKGGLPELDLVEVRLEARPGGLFEVHGKLRNSGTGEVVCPIVLRTDRDELWQKVRVGDRAASPFSFATAQKPLLVELDPAGTCLRFVVGTAPPAKVSL